MFVCEWTRRIGTQYIFVSPVWRSEQRQSTAAGSLNSAPNTPAACKTHQHNSSMQNTRCGTHHVLGIHHKVRGIKLSTQHTSQNKLKRIELNLAHRPSNQRACTQCGTHHAQCVHHGRQGVQDAIQRPPCDVLEVPLQCGQEFDVVTGLGRQLGELRQLWCKFMRVCVCVVYVLCKCCVASVMCTWLCTC